ncbi:MAG: protein kinase [Thermoproteota archaeon]
MAESYVKIRGYELRELKVLGETDFATSYLAESKDGKKYVVKRFHIERINPAHLSIIFNNNKFINEAVENHRDAEGCKNVREIYAIGNKLEPYIISEYLAYSLEEYMEKRKISIEQAIRISLDVARCLKFIFEKSKIECHGDICPKNIFIDEVNGELIVKVGDFDGALTTDRSIQQVLTHTRYRPPELGALTLDMLKERKFDVYSLGLILAELVAGPPAVDSILSKGPSAIDRVIANEEIREIVRDAIKPHSERMRLEKFIERLESLEKPLPPLPIKTILQVYLTNLEELQRKLKAGQAMTDSDKEKYKKLNGAWPKIEKLMELYEKREKEEVKRLSEELNRELSYL